MSFESDKACLMEKIRIMSCPDYDTINAAMLTYEDALTLFHAYSETFDCSPAYAKELLSCIDAGELATLKVYFNQTLEPETPIVNPTLVVDVTSDSLLITENIEELVITGKSDIKNIVITPDVQVGILSISGGARVGTIDMGGDTCIGYLRVTACKENRSSLKGVVKPACVREMRVDVEEGAYFGGFICDDETPEACASPVTEVIIDKLTPTSMRLGWMVPENSIYTAIRYRMSGGGNWFPVLADRTPGHYEADDEKKYFVFTDLRPNTYYDLEVYNICSGGGRSEPVKIAQLTPGVVDC